MTKAPVQSSYVDSYNWRGYLERLLIKKKNQGHATSDTYRELYNATRNRNWRKVQDFLQFHSESVTVRLTESADTLLHRVAESLDEIAVQLVEKIVTIAPATLELTDVYGNTALSRAATAGNTRALKIMLSKNMNLLYIENKDEHGPLDHAARFGHKKAVDYLLSVTLSNRNDRRYSGAKGARLLTYLISSSLYGAAVCLLQHYPELLRDTTAFRKMAFEKLARKPRAFRSADPRGIWRRLIYYCIPVVDENPGLPLAPENVSQTRNADGDIENPDRSSECSSTRWPLCRTAFRYVQRIFVASGRMTVPSFRRIHNEKLKHKQALALSKIMCARVDWSDDDAHDILRSLTVVPARLGNYELILEIINAHPPAIMTLDDEGLNIFQRAVMFRNEEVVKLLHKHVLVRQWVETFKDHRDANKNILHLAGKLSPSRRVAGAALQMQRELQWFKAVELLVHPSLQEEESNYETPREYFTAQHKKLVKDGEEWMKTTATSCSVVAALIVTVVFAAAFTAPGGNNLEGVPNFLNDQSFLIFAACDALALFSSTTSVLMFLSMLTSRYAEDDFLESLPRKLIIGLIMLFFSIVTMIVAFGAALHLLLVRRIKWVWLPIALLICVPVSLFAGQQIPLLLDMVRSTYFSKLLRKPKKKGLKKVCTCVLVT